jgi:ATP-dependent helicase/nuclease subunit A
MSVLGLSGVLSIDEAIRREASLAISAGAGTGKTYQLTERYYYHLTQGLSPLEIVAVTFTERAANELRSRIRERVQQARESRPNTLAEIEASPISTLHSLAARICREHPEAAGVPADFRILDELDDALWTADQLDLALDQLPSRFYRLVPYELAGTALQALLDDPLAAEASLGCSADGWEDLAATERRAALVELTENPIWCEAVATLTGSAGATGDLIEIQRRNCVSALLALADGAFPREPLEAIDRLSIQGGKGASWPAGNLQDVKDAIRDIRKLAQAALKEGLVTLVASGPADDRLRELLPILRDAFDQVRARLVDAKRRRRVLTFADLEVHATRALRNPDVRSYYAERWKAFLVDEFQDTNPVQAAILADLIGPAAILTIVGDPKQSIYGFRRADSRVFESFFRKIVARGGQVVPLNVSHRTHGPLVKAVNGVSAKVLGDRHQDLAADRKEAPHPGPHLRAYTVVIAGDTAHQDQRRWVEARHVASLLKHMLDAETLVHERNGDCLRPMAPGDVAILARAWDTLDRYVDALGALKIPTALAGGGSLLNTREAKDGVALLQFLADPDDDLALAAVLRGPFFAVNDRALFLFARSLRRGSSWWFKLGETSLSELIGARVILDDLVSARRRELPSALLQLADRRCAYTAVIANLANARRREADWTGFVALIRSLEQGNGDVFTVSRQLKRLIESEVDVPRPLLQASDAVTLMTVHGAKGLEWPVVVLPDLARRPPTKQPDVFFDPELGVALKLEVEAGVPVYPMLYTVLQARARRREEEEARRLLYVALTRARDHLILTASDATGTDLDRLRPGLVNAHIDVDLIPYDPERARPPEPVDPPLPPEPGRVFVDPIELGLTAIPASGLSEYAVCPKRFHFRFVDAHPGAGEGEAIGRRIGALTHVALEHDIVTVEDLLRREPDAIPLLAQEAMELARRYRELSVYAHLRDPLAQREQRVFLNAGGLGISGTVDQLSESFLVDFKTDAEIRPEQHRFQIWAYAHATRRATAHIAYLRHDYVHTFDETSLRAAGEEIPALILGIRQGQYPAAPSHEHCHWCPYAPICSDRYTGVPGEAPLGAYQS